MKGNNLKSKSISKSVDKRAVRAMLFNNTVGPSRATFNPYHEVNPVLQLRLFNIRMPITLSSNR